MKFLSCSASSLNNIKLANSSQTHVLIRGCGFFNICNLLIEAPGTSPNTDGTHIQSLQHVSIANTVMETGNFCDSSSARPSLLQSEVRNVRLCDFCFLYSWACDHQVMIVYPLETTLRIFMSHLSRGPGHGVRWSPILHAISVNVIVWWNQSWQKGIGSWTQRSLLGNLNLENNLHRDSPRLVHKMAVVCFQVLQYCRWCTNLELKKEMNFAFVR